MGQINNKLEELSLDEKTENLIAIGAAMASNCIPCFEHLYEKAITSGISLAQIKRASELAGQVKNGAHTVLTNSVNELIGEDGTTASPYNQAKNKSCSC